MNWGLPIPSSLYFPKAFHSSAALSALQAKIDYWLALWETGAQAVLYMTDIARCPSIFLPELGYLLQAGIVAADSDQAMRIKIATAIAAHQEHGTWLYDVEPKIFGITGIVPVLFGGQYIDWWIRSGNSMYPLTSYWAIRGGNNDPNLTGMIREGSGNEEIIGCVVRVDLGSSGLSAAQIAAIVASIINSVPTYFRAFLGWTAAGVFTPYAGGQIN